MPHLIERLRNVFDDHLRSESHSAGFLGEAGAFQAAEILVRSNDLTAALLELKRQSDTGMNLAFARLHELTFSLHLTPAPDEFRQAVQFIVESAERQAVAARSEQRGPHDSDAVNRASEHEQLPLSLRPSL